MIWPNWTKGMYSTFFLNTSIAEKDLRTDSIERPELVTAEDEEAVMDESSYSRSLFFTKINHTTKKPSETTKTMTTTTTTRKKKNTRKRDKERKERNR